MQAIIRLGRWIVGEGNLDKIERADLPGVEVPIKDNEIYLCRRLVARSVETYWTDDVSSNDQNSDDSSCSRVEA